MSFKVQNCRVSISFYFFAMLAAAAAMPGGGSTVAAGMIAAVIHECGHLIAIGTVCRAGIAAVRLDPLGMSIQTEAADAGSDTQPFAVLSGMAANLLAAGLIAAVRLLSGSYGVDKLTAANLCLAVVNALPAKPLDGGQLLSWMLIRRFAAARADRISFVVSLAAIITMTAAGVLILLRSRYNFSMLFMGLWLFAVVIKDYI